MEKKNFVGFEYIDRTVKKAMEPMLVDGYENFGWSFDGTTPSEFGKDARCVTLRFKRDRKLVNKTELIRLQRQFDSYVEEITSLENAKVNKASIIAFVIGIIGCAFMAGSVFAITHEPPMVTTCVILAIPGFMGWILPYFAYLYIKRKSTIRIIPEIDQKYEEIYGLCEKANMLSQNNEMAMR